MRVVGGTEQLQDVSVGQLSERGVPLADGTEAPRQRERDEIISLGREDLR